MERDKAGKALRRKMKKRKKTFTERADTRLQDEISQLMLIYVTRKNRREKRCGRGDKHNAYQR